MTEYCGYRIIAVGNAEYDALVERIELGQTTIVDKNRYGYDLKCEIINGRKQVFGSKKKHGKDDVVSNVPLICPRNAFANFYELDEEWKTSGTQNKNSRQAYKAFLTENTIGLQASNFLNAFGFWPSNESVMPSARNDLLFASLATYITDPWELPSFQGINNDSRNQAAGVQNNSSTNDAVSSIVGGSLEGNTPRLSQTDGSQTGNDGKHFHFAEGGTYVDKGATHVANAAGGSVYTKGANHTQNHTVNNNFEKGSLNGATIFLDKSGTQSLLNSRDENLQHENDFNKNGVQEEKKTEHCNTETSQKYCNIETSLDPPSMELQVDTLPTDNGPSPFLESNSSNSPSSGVLDDNNDSSNFCFVDDNDNAINSSGSDTKAGNNKSSLLVVTTMFPNLVSQNNVAIIELSTDDLLGTEKQCFKNVMGSSASFLQVQSLGAGYTGLLQVNDILGLKGKGNFIPFPIEHLSSLVEFAELGLSVPLLVARECLKSHVSPPNSMEDGNISSVKHCEFYISPAKSEASDLMYSPDTPEVLNTQTKRNLSTSPLKLFQNSVKQVENGTVANEKDGTSSKGKEEMLQLSPKLKPHDGTQRKLKDDTVANEKDGSSSKGKEGMLQLSPKLKPHDGTQRKLKDGTVANEKDGSSSKGKEGMLQLSPKLKPKDATSMGTPSNQKNKMPTNQKNETPSKGTDGTSLNVNRPTKVKMPTKVKIEKKPAITAISKTGKPPRGSTKVCENILESMQPAQKEKHLAFARSSNQIIHLTRTNFYKVYNKIQIQPTDVPNGSTGSLSNGYQLVIQKSDGGFEPCNGSYVNMLRGKLPMKHWVVSREQECPFTVRYIRFKSFNMNWLRKSDCSVMHAKVESLDSLAPKCLKSGDKFLLHIYGYRFAILSDQALRAVIDDATFPCVMSVLRLNLDEAPK